MAIGKQPGTSTGDTLRDGNVVVEEHMNRRDGLVEYEGTTEGPATASSNDHDSKGPGAMQAGSTVLAGTALEEDRPTATGGKGVPDMSADNTTSGIGHESPSNQLLSHIREGMKVIDANGDNVGKVEYLQMGDPDAATVGGAGVERDHTLVEDAVRAFGARDEPNVPEPFRSELLREGFVKVDGPGWIDTDRYLRAADIANVEKDTIRLRVAKETLPSDKV